MSRDPEHLERLKDAAGDLPARPGVYLFMGGDGEVLYVGKAKSLRSRVRSYFARNGHRSLKVRHLLRRVEGIETFVLDSEAEALLLEWNLIKEHAPRFNVELRDDKSYPYVKVTTGEAYPRVLVTRRLERDGSRYFGPFANVGAMRKALRTIKGMYRVRTCHYDMPEELPERPCLDYHIGRCEAPCAGLQSGAEYREAIDEILEILSGRTDALRRKVRKRMEEAADRMDFERAAELRDVMEGLDLLERERTTVDFRGGDRDVLGFEREGPLACGVLLRVRGGRLLGREIHYVRNAAEESPAEVTGAFVKGFYLRRERPPAELLVPEEFADRELVEEYLSVRREAPFRIHAPRRGRKRRLVELAGENAAHVLRQEREAGPRGEGAAEGGAAKAPGKSGRPASPGERTGRALARALGLEGTIRSLVCFDVSTLQGSDSTGSAVWLRDGRPRKSEYRHFRIRGTPEGKTDDYAMMHEIVSRYFHRRVREGGRLPDLVVVDGGKGQLGAARQALESAGASDLPLAALAKREEEVFRPGEPEPRRLERRDPALHWLQRARDEAHRFAISYSRKLRRRRTLRSRLAEVPGVGPAREQALLTRFGSLDAIRTATPEELTETPGVGCATARRIAKVLGSGTGALPRPDDREEG